jgi:tetratricopeptide (TPR) repeat protein
MKYRAPLSFLVAALFALSASPALAEDWESPPFYGEDVALEEECLPEGWSLVEDSAGKPDPAPQAKVNELAAAAKIGSEYVTFASQLLKDGDGNLVTLVLVDVDQDPKDLTGPVKAAALAAGWGYAELGNPSRFVLAVGEEKARQTALKTQREAAVNALARAATKKLGRQAGNPTQAAKLARAALAIAPDAASPHAILGLVKADGLGINKDVEAWEEAVKEFRLAFKANAPHAPEGVLAQEALGTYGLALLQRKDPERDKEARDALKRAVALGKSGSGLKPVWVHQYNLACAHSRLGEKADALRELEGSLELAKEDPPGRDFERFVKNDVAGDEDFAPLKDDPAFQEVLKKALAGSSSDGV